MNYRRPVVVAALVAIAATSAYYYLSHRQPVPPDEKAVSAAEDEVYEAVVRDMLAPPGKTIGVTQLVFADTLIIGRVSGPDGESCQESVRKEFSLADDPPPFNSFADKIYRAVTRGGYDRPLRDETIQAFAERSCSVGHLSQTFHTDLPRTFIASESVYFDGWRVDKSLSKPFEQLFPGAAGILSFSHVGFDPSLNEAIVSSSFVCGGLCGTGQRYILKKRRGRWQVVSSRIVWMS